MDTAKKINLKKVDETIAKSRRGFFKATGILFLIWLAINISVMKIFPGFGKFVVIGTTLPIAFGIVLWLINAPLVRVAMSAKLIKNRSEAEVLWDIVHEISEQEGCKVPSIYLVDTPGMNAFAFGLGIDGFNAVGATQGIIDKLTRNELKAVMAHEVGHVNNRDMPVSMFLTVIVMSIVFLGWLLKEIAPYLVGRGDSDSDSSSSSSGSSFWVDIIRIVGVIFLGGFIYYIGGFLGNMLKLYVSRMREYAADATGSRIMEDSIYLESALNKIVENPDLGGTKANAVFGFLCTADPSSSDELSLEEAMSTHPSLDNRIKALRDLMV